MCIIFLNAGGRHSWRGYDDNNDIWVNAVVTDSTVMSVSRAETVVEG